MKFVYAFTTALVLHSTASFATVEQFVELCNVEVLPQPTQATFKALRDFASTSHEEDLDCNQLAAALQKVKRLDLPGHTFHYYRTPDLTPISLLDWMEELYLSGQRIESLAPLERMKLTSLDISHVNGELEVLRNIPTLEILKVNLDDSESHPANLQNLLKLTKLEAYVTDSIDLEFLPDGIKDLVIKGPGRMSLNGIEHLSSLQSLTLEGVKLNNLKGLENFSDRALKLQINGSKIKNYNAIASLARNLELTITRSNLSDIKFLSKLTGLRKLILGGNDISDVTPLASLTDLAELDLADNKIFSINGLENLTSLKSLLLNDNQISTVTLGRWPGLEVLELTKNHLLHGPQLSMEPNQYRLQYLGLGLNKLSVFSAQLAKIKTIKTLGLSENKLIRVDELTELVNLETLNLADNKLVDLSPLSGLSNLKRLTTYDNPLVSQECPVQPATVCGQ